MVRVGLLGIKGDFSDYRSRGERFYRYTYELARRLPRNREGIKVSTIEVRETSVGKGLSIMLDTLSRDLSGYDIVHNTDLNPFFPGRRGNAAIVTTAHDMQFVIEPKLNADVDRTPKGKVWTQLVLNLGLRSTLMSDYIIAVSTLTKNDMIKLGFERSKIFVVNHGIDERFFAKTPKREQGKEFKVGYIGMLRTRKNLPFAIDAFKMLKGRCSFEIWGKKSYDYEPLAKMAKPDKRIRFMGFAPDNRFVKIIDSFDAFVWPSLYEGFGIPIIEAQARGVPVIIYKKGKIPEETRKHCIEARDEEHMVEILEGIRERGYDAKRRKAAIAYARSFTWDKTARETLEVYKKMASG